MCHNTEISSAIFTVAISIVSSSNVTTSTIWTKLNIFALFICIINTFVQFFHLLCLNLIFICFMIVYHALNMCITVSRPRTNTSQNKQKIFICQFTYCFNKFYYNFIFHLSYSSLLYRTALILFLSNFRYLPF
jgi:uncharacterized membrane protein